MLWWNEKRSKHSKVLGVYFTYVGGKTPLADRAQIFLGRRYPRRNHVCQIWWRSVQGFSVGWGSNFAIPHWLWLSSLQHSHTTVWACDGYSSHNVAAGQRTAKKNTETSSVRTCNSLSQIFCLPNSPDACPLGWTVYHHQSFSSVEEIKRAIVKAWQKRSRSSTKSVGEWRRNRLECTVRQNGGHIEHVLN